MGTAIQVVNMAIRIDQDASSITNTSWRETSCIEETRQFIILYTIGRYGIGRYGKAAEDRGGRDYHKLFTSKTSKT